jgi:hypothetical protein
VPFSVLRENDLGVLNVAIHHLISIITDYSNWNSNFRIIKIGDICYNSPVVAPLTPIPPPTTAARRERA